jgi:hypothetical protein
MGALDIGLSKTQDTLKYLHYVSAHNQETREDQKALKKRIRKVFNFYIYESSFLISFHKEGNIGVFIDHFTSLIHCIKYQART